MTFLCRVGVRRLVTLRQLSYCFGDLRQLRVGGAALQPQSVIDGGSAADHGSGGNVVGDAALGYGDGAVSDLDVAGARPSPASWIFCFTGAFAAPRFSREWRDLARTTTCIRLPLWNCRTGFR